MSVTVRYIAKNCGVSLATVSRVLNNNDKVTDATRRKVVEAMRVLNYDPMQNVPAIKKRSVDATGLVIPVWSTGMAGDYYNRVINSFTAQMDHQAGRCLLLTGDKFCRAILEDRVNPRTTLGIDRLVLAGVDHPELETVYDRLEKWDIPFVLIRRETGRAGVPAIVNNDCAGMEKILHHLAERGHTRTAFFNTAAPYLEIRTRTFREFTERDGWYAHEDLVHVDNFVTAAAAAWLDTVLHVHKVSAVICTADETACWVIRSARKKGIRVPEDLSVASFNGGPLTEIYDPSITSLRIPVEQMVELGLLMLNRGRAPGHESENRVELPLELTVRESTGICRTDRN